MSVNTRINDAHTRVQCERDAVETKLDAIDRFTKRVEALTPKPTSSVAQRSTATGTLFQATHSTEDRCQAVRRAFAETIRPHSVEDVEEGESLCETIEAEFSESLAVALAPTTDTSFSPKLKRAVVSEAKTRQMEADVLRCALEREASQLDEAGAVIEETTEWIATKDEIRLTSLGFDELRCRHETLADHRTRCEELARQRQAFLHGTTSKGAEVGISHGSLIPYIYRDFPIDHPVLATVARLERTCTECQQSVRHHLVRRA